MLWFGISPYVLPLLSHTTRTLHQQHNKGMLFSPLSASKCRSIYKSCSMCMSIFWLNSSPFIFLNKFSIQISVNIHDYPLSHCCQGLQSDIEQREREREKEKEKYNNRGEEKREWRPVVGRNNASSDLRSVWRAAHFTAAWPGLRSGLQRHISVEDLGNTMRM